jgi:Zn-dependent M28 family amino/carboxypeptidase
MHRRFILAGALALTAILSTVPAATTAVGTDTTALRNAVTVSGIMSHETALQQIATQNPVNGVPTRAAGTPGYARSVDYVAGKLSAAGYNVTIQDFTYSQWRELTPSAFERISPSPRTYASGFENDYLTMQYSGSGDVTAQLVPTNDILPRPAGSEFTPGGSTSGCEAGDYPATVAGNVALVQRGTCPFRQKAETAQAAGALAVVIFNEGNDDPSDDRFGVINGTLDPPIDDLPVIGTSFAVGEELYNQTQAGTVTVRVKTDTTVVTTATSNVLADTPGGRSDRVVLVGAHLDSVAEGPGINDNGSGVSANLETALQMASLGIKPVNKVRFAFWGGEEDGLIGSQYYVDNLPKKALNSIMLNLNFDMVGSPNYVRFVYDGDGSAFGTDGPSGSGRIEDVFVDYFAGLDLASEPTEFDGRSDYDAFINAGIPAGGLFTGAEGIKTAEQALIYGGTAGVAYDRCYHQLCDDLTNLNADALDEMSDATAHATLLFAMSGSSVNGTDKASNKAKDTMLYKGSKLFR